MKVTESVSHQILFVKSSLCVTKLERFAQSPLFSRVKNLDNVWRQTKHATFTKCYENKKKLLNKVTLSLIERYTHVRICVLHHHARLINIWCTQNQKQRESESKREHAAVAAIIRRRCGLMQGSRWVRTRIRTLTSLFFGLLFRGFYICTQHKQKLNVNSRFANID